MLLCVVCCLCLFVACCSPFEVRVCLCVDVVLSFGVICLLFVVCCLSCFVFSLWLYVILLVDVSSLDVVRCAMLCACCLFECC